MDKKILIFLLVLFFGGIVFFVSAIKSRPSKTSNSEEIYQTIIAQRDLAIKKAVESGDYECCITPPCTMCYMEANQWNNFKAGTCACDDLIAQGKEPCPQCKKDFCQGSEEETCPVDFEEQ